MENNESEDTKLRKPNLGDSLDNLRLAEPHDVANYEHLNTTEALLDTNAAEDLLDPNATEDLLDTNPAEDLLDTNAAEDLLDTFMKSVEDTTPTCSDRDIQNDQIDDDSTLSNNGKESAETEMPKSLFHLSDNMKKDLSLLAYPSKTLSRKKGIISSRVIPNTRITIAEALEKAEDARKSITNLHATAGTADTKEIGISNLPSQHYSSDKSVHQRDKRSQDMMGLLPHTDIPEHKKMKKLDSAVTSQSVVDGSPTSDATVNESASCSQGKTVSVAGKTKSPGTARIQMTRRMLELLKFTFIHEHFPSSVHMARLAKMMGIPWAQVRNWFTDRRVANKKAGLYPRDKPLVDCPHCNVTLQTEADQKSHLFSTQHVKSILGPEYCGGGTSESIKWKKLPKTVNAVSRVSGARILAVGFSAEDTKKTKKVQEEKKMEAAVEEVPRSKELKKLWTDAMLLPEKKEQSQAEWNSVRINVEKNSDSHCEPYMQEKNESQLQLKIQDEKEKVSELKHHENMYGGKVVVNSRVVSIPVNVDNIIPGSVSDNFPATVTTATTANTAAPASLCNSDFLNTSVSSVMPEDISVIYERESPRKVTAFGKKPNIGGTLESLTESRRPTALSMKPPQKAYKITISNNMKSKKPTGSTSGLGRLSNISKEKKTSKSLTLSSQFTKDFELKQESEFGESWSRKNNITLYKGNDNNDPSQCEMAVLNTNKQPVTINQSSAACASSPLRNLRLQKTSTVTQEASTVKLGTGSAVNKISKISMDKRKARLQTQPLGSVLRTNKVTACAHEGNIIVGYQCPNCNKVYQTEWLMMKHSVTHFKYHCDICYQVYPTETMMKIHLLDHLSGAYEDEKYYCQFSCKVCHSLKCGCYEPTYCKPQDLPRIFYRPQKAKRSKKGFTSKNNSGPNDHLKISLSTYRKLLVSESLGNTSKEKLENSTSQKPVLIEDVQKILVLQDEQKPSSLGDSQISTLVLREAQVSKTSAETPKVHHMERENKDLISVKGETNHATLTKERGTESIAGICGEQSEVSPNVSAVEGKTLITETKKLMNLKEIKRKLTVTNKSDVIPSSQPSCFKKLEETVDLPGAKRAVSRRRPPKLSSNFIYKDADFYYMCEMCDASFTSKAELSEHMFLHRLKSRSRRWEKRGISSVIEEKEVPKKLKTNESTENHSCELCHNSFATLADYRAHKILAHNEPKPQPIEVYRCNYCGKKYRRRRELKRHFKRDCKSAPPSLRGKLSGLSNVIEESHYTTVKVGFHDKSDVLAKSVSKTATKGPIVCRYCLAVTKREAEMKRHIWKFCLKVPSEVVKKFMDGASLGELGFKYINNDGSTEATSTDMPQTSHPDNSGMQNTVEDSVEELESILSSTVSPESSPEKLTSLDVKTSVQLQTSETQSSLRDSLQLSPDKKTVQEDISADSSTTKAPLEEPETSSVQSAPSEELESTVHSEKSNIVSEHSELAEKQSATKPLTEEIKMESVCTTDEVAQSAASTSPLASPVMQFPLVLPVMTPSAKSKRPLVCGYCGIWYFREMAILKHMKERCIKIPDFEKELLKSHNTLCNASQKTGGVGIAPENGAVYKMVKVPEHMQNTPVPMPKDVSNEDIKELNTNIKAYSENTPSEVKPVNEQQENTPSLPNLPPVNQTRTTPTKRGSRCRRCHEHFSSQEAVLAHSSVHHGPKKGFYKCKLCHARLAKYKQLREHVWEHTNENPYRCHLCEVRYRSSDSLVEHLLTQHQYTSIHDKNLYKWLPGRHGKYREIKTKDTSCEEKLDDLDTNLDSVAEVMVITDNDICSNTTSDSKPEHLGDTESMKEKNGNLIVESICNEKLSENYCKSNETKATLVSLNVTSNTECNVDNNLVDEGMIVDKRNNSTKGEKNTKEISGKISCGTPTVKIASIQEESEGKERTSKIDFLCSKSGSNFEEQNEEKIERTYVENDDCEMDDGFTGEGLLPLVENLDSVVETIQLTDKHLS